MAVTVVWGHPLRTSAKNTVKIDPHPLDRFCLHWAVPPTPLADFRKRGFNAVHHILYTESCKCWSFEIINTSRKSLFQVQLASCLKTGRRKRFGNTDTVFQQNATDYILQCSQWRFVETSHILLQRFSVTKRRGYLQLHRTLTSSMRQTAAVRANSPPMMNIMPPTAWLEPTIDIPLMKPLQTRSSMRILSSTSYVHHHSANLFLYSAVRYYYKWQCLPAHPGSKHANEESYA